MKYRGAVAAAAVRHVKPAENKIAYEPEAVVDLTLLEDFAVRVRLSNGEVFDAPKLVSVGWDYEAKDFESFIFHGRRYRNQRSVKSKEAFRKKYWDRRLKMTSVNPNKQLDSGNVSRNNATFSRSVAKGSVTKKEQAMKLSKSDAVALMEALDYKTAARWSVKKLADKITGLPDILDEETEVEDKKLAKLLKKVLKAVENEDEIVVLEDEAEEEEAVEEAPKPKKKGAKKAVKRSRKKASDDEDDEEEESVPVKPKPAKKGPGKRGVGVIATIIAELRKANAKKPTTKEKILAVLVKKFPDRDPKAMKSTISSQVPSGLRTEKGLEVQSNDKGVWLDPE